MPFSDLQLPGRVWGRGAIEVQSCSKKVHWLHFLNLLTYYMPSKPKPLLFRRFLNDHIQGSRILDDRNSA